MSKLGTLANLKELDLKQAVVVCVSDTIYGFHARADSEKAKRRIRLAKERLDHFIVLVRSIEDAKSLCQVSHAQETVLRSYWPGPITFILTSNSGGATQAIRMPSDPFCKELIDTFGGPILSTSCNRPGMPPISSVTRAMEEFHDKADLYIDGGDRTGIHATTIVDLTDKNYIVLRSGSVTFEPQHNRS